MNTSSSLPLLLLSTLAALSLPACSTDDPSLATSDPATAGHGGSSGSGSGGSSGSGQSGKGQGGSGQSGSGSAGTAGSGQGGSLTTPGLCLGAANSGQAGSGQAGSGQAGSGQAGSGQAGSGQSGSGQSGSGTAGAAGSGLSCDGSKAAGIALATVDDYHYPSYGLDGCQLLYLAPAGTSAELRLRDLATGDETLLAPASDHPRRPSLAWPVAAWEATEGGHQVVRVWTGGTTTTLAGAFAQATEPGAAPDAVVFTSWAGTSPSADTDVAVYLVSTGQIVPLFTGPAQQRFASISATHVAFTDFAEDPDGWFQPTKETLLADVVLYDRMLCQLETHPLPGKQAFPLVGSAGHVVYLDWPNDRPEPKFQAYSIHAWDLAASPVDPDRLLDEVQTLGQTEYARPSTRDGLVEWVAGSSTLRRAHLSDNLPPETLPGFPDQDVFFPASAGPFSLVATRPAGQSTPPVLSVLTQ
jgi:hypothetical protein